MPITTHNNGCVRFVLVRTAHCVVHDIEMREGVHQSIASRDASTEVLTDRGREMASKLTVDALVAFARGAYQLDSGNGGVSFADSPILCCDDSTGAKETAKAAGWYKDHLVYGHVQPALPLLSEWRHKENEIQIVILLASSTLITQFLALHGTSYNLGLPLGKSALLSSDGEVSLRLGSISMIDVFPTENRDSFIHCVGNTALNPNVCWWLNSN